MFCEKLVLLIFTKTRFPMNKKLSFFLALIIMTGFLSGCANTWSGAGKDLQGIGGWLENTFSNED